MVGAAINPSTGLALLARSPASHPHGAAPTATLRIHSRPRQHERARRARPYQPASSPPYDRQIDVPFFSLSWNAPKVPKTGRGTVARHRLHLSLRSTAAQFVAFGSATDMRLLAGRDEIRCFVDVRTFWAAECASSTVKFERDLHLAARGQMYMEAIETWAKSPGRRHPRATCLRRRRTPSRAARLSRSHDILI